MQVRIRSDVFKDGGYLGELDNLLAYFRKGKHILCLDDYDDIEAYNDSKWKKDLNSRDIKVIESYIRSSVKFNKSYKSITVSLNDNKIDFLPREAEKYLDQTLMILLENSQYDSPFLNAIFRHFDNENIILKAKTEQFWKYCLGGGSSFVNVIQAELNESFQDACYTKDKKKYLRYFVVLDSDKFYPEMEVDSTKTDFLVENEVPFHILIKREKENYVPLNLLGRLDSRYLKEYIKFPKDVQRDYFDLEKGFHDKNYNKLPDPIKTLYPAEDVLDEPFKILRKGMDIDLYKKGGIKKEFSLLFNDATKEGLLKIIGHQSRINKLNEFEHIVNEVKKIL